MIGRTYLLRGEPVVVLVRADWTAGGPRNVLVERADGSRLVRPFRGLRRPISDALPPASNVPHGPESPAPTSPESH